MAQLAKGEFETALQDFLAAEREFFVLKADYENAVNGNILPDATVGGNNVYILAFEEYLRKRRKNHLFAQQIEKARENLNRLRADLIDYMNILNSGSSLVWKGVQFDNKTVVYFDGAHLTVNGEVKPIY